MNYESCRFVLSERAGVQPNRQNSYFFMKKIPLRNRKHEIIAHALVDDEDYQRVMDFGPWCLTGKAGNKYVGKTLYLGKTDGRDQFRLQLLSRFLMGNPVGKEIDHRDGNFLNNQKSNLRAGTHTENMSNAKLRKDNKSGAKGVFFRRETRKFRVKIGVDRKQIQGGQFDTLEEATRRYAELSEKYHKEFGRLK